MMKPLKKNATYADLCAVPENFVAEILGGELYASPQPAVRHVRAASALGALLAGPFQFGVNGPGGWLILDEPELHFTKKLTIYAREGVQHVWLLDPLRQLLEVLQLDGQRWDSIETHAGDDRVRPQPFAAVELELGALWA